MAADLAAFRKQFPEFSEQNADDDAVERALAEAIQIHDKKVLATLYVAAHILTVERSIAAGNTGASGAVKAEGAGPFRIDYVALAKDGDIRAELARTQYGARALLLESRTPRTAIGAMVVG